MKLQLYTVQKSTRVDPNRTDSYTGPTCYEAGVLPGQIYTNRKEAERDAQRLSEFNPVGFVVVDLVISLDTLLEELRRLRQEHYTWSKIKHMLQENPVDREPNND